MRKGRIREQVGRQKRIERRNWIQMKKDARRECFRDERVKKRIYEIERRGVGTKKDATDRDWK